jgi:hypothetical protein
MNKNLPRLKKILTTRICSTSFAVFIGLILLAAAYLFFMPVVPGSFWEWFVERISELIHQWF